MPTRIGRKDLIEEAEVALAVTAWVGLAARGVATFLYIEGLDLPPRPPAPLRLRAKAIGIALITLGSLGMVRSALVLADRSTT